MNRHVGGFTLIELMVVLVILAILAMVAVPALTKDNRSAEFENFSKRFAMDVQRAHMEAISSKEERAILLYTNKYTINAVLPGSTTFTKVAERQAPVGVTVYGILKVAADPKRTYTLPTGGISGGEEIRFRGTGDVAYRDGATYEDVSVSVFFMSGNKKIRSRVVIYQSTGFSTYYKGWEW